MPGDRGLQEVGVVVRVRFKPLRPAGPRAGVKQLDEHARGWQGGMHRCGDGLQTSQAGFQGQSWSSHKWMIRSVRSLETSTCAVVWLEQR